MTSDSLEKVYSVFETPTQHTYGVSKTNTKLTHGLKITTHQLRLFKIKRHKYLLNFHYPATLPFLLLQNKKFHLSLTHTLCFSRTNTSILPSQLQTLTATTYHCRSSSVPTRLTFVSSENAFFLFLSHHRSTPITSTSIFPLSTPNLDSHYLASPIIISSDKTDLVSLENAQNCLSVVSNHNAESFLAAFISWLCKKG